MQSSPVDLQPNGGAVEPGRSSVDFFGLDFVQLLFKFYRNQIAVGFASSPVVNGHGAAPRPSRESSEQPSVFGQRIMA